MLKMLGGVKVSLFAQRKAGGGGILGPSVGPYTDLVNHNKGGAPSVPRPLPDPPLHTIIVLFVIVCPFYLLLRLTEMVYTFCILRCTAA